MLAYKKESPEEALPGAALAFKLDAPPESRNHIARSAVVEKMLAKGGGKLVLVRAPAGFGKTTALTQARQELEKSAVQTAWMTADAADNDAVRFLFCLAKGIERVCPKNLALVSGVMNNDGQAVGELALALIDRIRNAKVPFCLFIDEFESIQNPVVLGLVRELVSYLPAVGFLVIASRTAPDLGLGKLRSRERLIEIGTDDLRFSREETREFLCGRRGLALQEHHIGKLHQCTEGWITALWLASVTLERRPRAEDFIQEFDGTTTSIADYLAEDVVSALPQSVRDFLLKTSILQRLSAPLCDAVCERNDSARMLEAVERANLFLTPLDDKRQWFRYHGLFADFLRAQLVKEQPDLITQLNRRAAAWYIAQGRPVPAVEHALSCGDIEFALPLIAENAFNLLVEGRIRLLVRWLDSVPAEARAKQPALQVAHVWAVTLTRGQAEAMLLLEKLERDNGHNAEAMAHALALRPLLLSLQDNFVAAYDAARKNAALVPPKFSFPYGLVMNCLAQLSLIVGKYEEARRIVAETYASMGDKIGAFNLIFTETVEADIDLLHGNLRQATARLRQASSVAAPKAYPINGNAKAGISLAVALYEADDWELAERLLNICLPLIQELQLPDWLICGHVVLSRIAGIRGDSARALQLLAELECIGHKSRLPRAAVSARLERARLALLDGNLSSARDELDHAGGNDFWDEVEALSSFANDVETLTVARARYLIRSGAAADALTLLQESLAAAHLARRERRALKLKILLAAAHAAAANRPEGMRLMQEAVSFGAREGFVRTFVEEGEIVMDMLREIARARNGGGRHAARVPAAYLDRLLNAAGAPGADTDTPDESREALTSKEVDVLDLLAEGCSNKVIARRLDIAVTTVRTHLRNISAKLDARNRTQIVFIARRQGLIG